MPGSAWSHTPISVVGIAASSASPAPANARVMTSSRSAFRSLPTTAVSS